MTTVLLFASFFLRDPAVIITFVVATTLITLALRRAHRRRSPKQLLATLAASAALALIVAFTWLPGGGDYAALNPTHWSPRRIIDSATSLPAGFGTWAHGTDGPLNVLLYVPAGLAITALAPRLPEAWRVPAALIALSLVTEVWQALNGSRTGQLSDVIANGLGAILGTAATLAIRLLLQVHTRIAAPRSPRN